MPAPSPPLPLKKRPMDLFLLCWFSIFCLTSLVFEQYIVFDVDLAKSQDVIGQIWYWYAKSYDPVFLDTPLWLRVMCTIDAYVFGGCYLFFIYALIKGDNAIRLPALLYGSAIVYSTVVYFGWEFLDEKNRQEANLLAVFIVNIPYTIVPLLLMWRVRAVKPFDIDAGRDK